MDTEDLETRIRRIRLQNESRRKRFEEMENDRQLAEQQGAALVRGYGTPAEPGARGVPRIGSPRNWREDARWSAPTPKKINGTSPGGRREDPRWSAPAPKKNNGTSPGGRWEEARWSAPTPKKINGTSPGGRREEAKARWSAPTPKKINGTSPRGRREEARWLGSTRRKIHETPPGGWQEDARRFIHERRVDSALRTNETPATSSWADEQPDMDFSIPLVFGDDNAEKEENSRDEEKKEDTTESIPLVCDEDEKQEDQREEDKKEDGIESIPLVIDNDDEKEENSKEEEKKEDKTERDGAADPGHKEEEVKKKRTPVYQGVYCVPRRRDSHAQPKDIPPDPRNQLFRGKRKSTEKARPCADCEREQRTPQKPANDVC